MLNQMYRHVVMIAAVAVTGIALVQPASAADYVLKYATSFPAIGVQGEGAKTLGRLIEENSDGEIDFQFYPGSQLGGKEQVLEGLRNGSIEMGEGAATDLSTYSSIWSVFAIPYLFDSGEQAVKVISDPRVASILNANAEANGFKIIGWWNMGERSILNSKKAVSSPDDLEGIKIRVMENPMLVKSITAMGATGTSMPMSEVYTAVQQKTIDGLENALPVLEANKLYEVAKYLSLTEQFIVPDPQMVSLRVYNALSPELQQALMTSGQQSQNSFNERWQSAAEDSLESLKSQGVKVNTVDKTTFRQAVSPLVQEFLEDSDDDLRKLYDTIVEVRDENRT